VVADTFSSTLGVLLMGTGNDNNTWGNNANTSVFQILEDSIANIFVSSATSGTVDLSGTAPPAGPSQARFWQLRFNGSLAGALTLKVPNLTKEWIIQNIAMTLNGFTFSIQTPSGTPITLPPGVWRVYCDGNNALVAWPQGFTQNLMSIGSAAAPSYSAFQEQNGGFYRFGTQDWRFSAGGVDIFRYTGAGAGAPNLVDILSGNSLAFAGVKFDPTAVVPTGTEIHSACIFPPSSSWYFEDGSAKSRTTDAALFNAITVATTGNTHGNTTIDNLPIDLRNLGLEGAFVEITGASLGTTIVSINSASSMTVSSAISGTNTGAALRILPFGQGDGSTTFNVPDRRGVALFGRDNMGGTAKGLLTASTAQGILGTKLNATGGEQAHTDTVAEMPVHNHTLTDPGHTHGVTQNAQVQNNQNLSGGGAQTVLPSPATITIQSATTGITLAPAGSGAAHNTIPPAAISNFFIKR
jgi:microcystin-dependent protein